MRVLMTTDTLGGVWTYAVELSHALQPYGVELALATLGRELSAAQRAEVSELEHVTVYESRYKLEWMRDPWDEVDAAGDWLQNIAREFRPDVVHLNDYSQGSRDWAVPVVVVGHSCVCSWFESVHREQPGPEWDTYRERVRSGLDSADLVVAPTRVMLELLRHYYGPLSSARVIHNARALPRLPCAPREPFVLAAGRIWDAGKNIALLADIADRIPWPIHVAGEHCHPDGVGAAVHPNLVSLGSIPQQQMPALYSRAALYALPAKYEPFGLTPLEAALCGCPLVLGDIATLREVWQDAAVFVDPGSKRAWKKALKQMIADASRRRMFATRARQRAGEFSTRSMGQEYFSTYAQLLETSRPKDSPLNDSASTMQVEGVA